MPVVMIGKQTVITKPKRDVPATSQIGAIQNPILEWLLACEEEIGATGTEQEKLVLEARGVPWNPKQFCKSCKRAYKKDGSPDSSKISTSLSRLEKRRLVIRHGSRTSHVKLTDKGRTQALAKRADPRTWQVKEAIKHARFLVGHISEDLHRYGDQISGKAQYIEFARLAYHLFTLEEHGEIRDRQRRELTHALSESQSAGFEHLLTIAQDSELKKYHAAELRGLHEKLQNRDVYIYLD